MILICWQEVCDRGDWIDGSPEQQELHKLGQTQIDWYGDKLTLNWLLISLGRAPPKRIGKASGSHTAFSGYVRSNVRISLWIRGDWNLVQSSIANEGLSAHAVRIKGSRAF